MIFQSQAQPPVSTLASPQPSSDRLTLPQQQALLSELATQLGLLVLENRSLSNQLSHLQKGSPNVLKSQKNGISKISNKKKTEKCGQSQEELQKEISSLEETLTRRLKEAQENEEKLIAQQKLNEELEGKFTQLDNYKKYYDYREEQGQKCTELLQLIIKQVLSPIKPQADDNAAGITQILEDISESLEQGNELDEATMNQVQLYQGVLQVYSEFNEIYDFGSVDDVNDEQWNEMAQKALIEIDGMMEEVNKRDYDHAQALPQEFQQDEDEAQEEVQYDQ